VIPTQRKSLRFGKNKYGVAEKSEIRVNMYNFGEKNTTDSKLWHLFETTCGIGNYYYVGYV